MYACLGNTDFYEAVTKKAFPITHYEPGDMFRPFINGGGQGMRADIAVTIRTQQALADVKTISPCPTHNPPSFLLLCHTKPCSVVEERQEKVHSDYSRKAKETLGTTPPSLAPPSLTSSPSAGCSAW